MRVGIIVSVVVVVLSELLVSRSASSAAAEPAAQKWQGKMQELYKTLSALTTDVSSDSRYDSSSGRARVDKNARKLMDLAHAMTSKKSPAPDSDSDPSIQLMAGLFQEQTQLAYTALKSGNRAYARG